MKRVMEAFNLLIPEYHGFDPESDPELCTNVLRDETPTKHSENEEEKEEKSKKKIAAKIVQLDQNGPNESSRKDTISHCGVFLESKVKTSHGNKESDIFPSKRTLDVVNHPIVRVVVKKAKADS